MAVIKELKEFMMRGNVVDMAVGVIVGGAFGKIVTSFVNDVIMPPIGVLLNGVDFKDLKLVIKDAIPASEGVEAVNAVTLNYGAFIQTILDFVIIATVIFFAIKGINSLRKKEEAPAEPEPEKPAEPTKEEVLLTEIRDLLKNKQ